jgi:hypothetical protein
MTDQRPLPTSSGPDDPFERELRALLRDRAAGTAPARLHETLTDVTRRPAPRAAAGWRRPVVSLVAAAAAILLIAAGFNPVSSWIQAITVPAASPSPSVGRPVVAVSSPVASPRSSAGTTVTPAIVWDSGLVRLTADSMRLVDEGITYTGLVPDVQVHGDPGGATYRTLEMEWVEGGRRAALNLYLASDGTDWWMEPIGGRSGDRSEVGGRIGEPWTGDIRMTAGESLLEMDGVTLDAFALETLPGSLLDCSSVVEPSHDADGLLTTDESDPLADGQPLAGTGILLMTPREAQDLLDSRGYCYLFRYRSGTSDEIQLWCSAPPGTIQGMWYGSDGQLRIDVRGMEPFAVFDPASAFGPGCAGDAVLPDASPSPHPAPASPAPAGPAFAWSGAGVTFTADALAIASGTGAGRNPATLPTEVIPTRQRTGPGQVEVRWEWTSDDRTLLHDRMLLVATVETDGGSWHVTELAFQDTSLDDTFRRWTSVPIEGRLGEPWSGDLDLRPADAAGAEASVQAANLVFDPGVTTADLEAPPSPMPIEDRPFSIDNGHVRLTADRLTLSHRGEVVHGPVISGSVQTATGTLVTNTLEASWFDEGRRVGLMLEFRNDGERWWVTEGTISARGMSWAPLDLPQVSAAMGEAWTGDLDLRLPQMRLDGTSRPTGERLHLVVENLSVQPFRGTLPRTMTGCVPVVDTTRTDWRTDPTRRGQPLATKGIVGLPTEKAAGVLEDLGYCYLFDRRLTADPTLGPSGILETWCDAPPGEVSGLRYGRGGEVHLIVLTQVPKGTPKRPSPVLGFGCQEGIPMPSDPPPPAPTSSPSTAPIAPMTDKPLVWDTGQARIAADSVTVTIGDRVIQPEPGSRGLRPQDSRGRPAITLDLGEDAAVIVTFATDDGGWSIGAIEVIGGGTAGGGPIVVDGLGVPMGQNLVGDLRIVGSELTEAGEVGVVLELDGAEISAFRPATARTLRDCQPPKALSVTGSDNPKLPGEPIDGLGLLNARATKAADAMDRLGYCYRFEVPSAQRQGFSLMDGAIETWCDAPAGVVDGLSYGPDGELVIRVKPDRTIKARPQPAVGWGCLSDIPGYGPQQQEAP